MPKHKPEKLNYAESIETLKKIVDRMSSNELTLEQSLQEFEDGIKLIKECQQTLTAAQQRVEILTADNTLEKFQSQNNDDD